MCNKFNLLQSINKCYLDNIIHVYKFEKDVQNMELSPQLYHWLVRPKWYNKYYLENRVKRLLEDFDFNNKSVLDFGCGIGSNCSLFSPEGYIGLDCDNRRINYAKYKNRNYQFEVSNEEVLPINDKSIDYIFIMAVLHHIPPNNITTFLRQFHKILKNNGKIMVIEPCVFKKSYFGNWFMKTLDKGKYIFNEEKYLKIFKDNNYNVEVQKKFKKCFIYNEIFFIAEPRI